MDRRSFLKKGTLTGLALSAAGAGLATHAAISPGKDMATSLTALPATDVNEATINSLQEAMKAGATTAAVITAAYLKRIQEIDQSGPGLNAVIEVNPDALAIADAMDKERAAGKVRGPLHGIPVLIKDNIDTGDKMMTTAGSLAMMGFHAPADAFIVRQLREAGAVLLGKTNLSEWANFRSYHSTSGWSSRGGQTKNPYVLDRNPSGSSSGSGAAVAANLCVVAIGTETDGSIVCPASANGIVGIKPTVGLLSRHGIIPISATQDTAGPMSRTVTDAAILLGVLTGVDTQDQATAASKGKSHTDYTQYLDRQGLKGKRIGVEKTFLDQQHKYASLFKAAIDAIKAQGATIVAVELLKKTNPLGENEFEVLKYEFKDGLNRYLADRKAPVKNLKDLIAFNVAHADKVMPYFQQELFDQSAAKAALTDKTYQEHLRKSRSGAQAAIDQLLQENKLDAIAGVTTGPSASIDLIYGDSSTGPSFTSPAAAAGYPHITVPMGQVQGLPTGLSFIAAAYGEPALISIAFAYEQATQHRKVPGFKLMIE